MDALASTANIPEVYVIENSDDYRLMTLTSHALRGLAGGQHHHRTNLDKYHPGYFGKVGMRHFHLQRNHEWKPVVSIDKLLSLIPAEHRGKYLDSSSAPNTAPVINLLNHGYAKLLGKGRITIPVVVQARYISAEAERKMKDAGGVVQLVA
ncbi:60S ribosomal protein L28 [Neocucurbitaria cava]|uniref:60S ribosomal protein L28 n=1 Tax=Neocucurbitaria cava TaxID=798079 RepID=A0A9W8YI93_9PLEO|nr:60S ribosomal protein L28 [Neocucurbitaria cava]